MVPKLHAPRWYYMYYPIEFTVDCLNNKFKFWRKKKRSQNKVNNFDEENVSGKVVVITGANSGIGKCVATEMAKRGAVVVMGCRNLEKGENARKEIMEETKSNTVELYHLDLSDLTIVRSFAAEVLKRHSVIDILVNNGGISMNHNKQPLTPEGWDLQMTTNHLGHFFLTNLLVNAILKSSVSRVVTVSSTGLIMSTMDLDDIMLRNPNSRKGVWNLNHYQNSKLANALFMKRLAKRYPKIKAYSLCPGFVRTEIFQHFEKKPFDWLLLPAAMRILGLDVEDGVETVLMCCLAKDVENDSGGFFRFGKRLRNVDKMLKDEVADKLWKISEEFVDLNKV